MRPITILDNFFREERCWISIPCPQS